MTLSDVPSAVARHRYVVVLGALLTTACMAFVATVPGVFYARSAVILLPPPSTLNPNVIATSSDSVVMFAGLVQDKVNHGRAPVRTSSEVTLIARGVHNGWSVRLPDSGGQWASNFDRPILELEVAGPTPEVVAMRLEDLVTEVERTARELQQEQGVDRFNMISTREVPRQAGVIYARGHRVKAIAVTAMLGLGMTCWAMVIADRRSGSGRRKRTPAADM